MIRRKIEEDTDNPDRWLVSYADFVTLLFAFFVVMYSISSVNQKKYRQLSSSINTAFVNEKQATTNVVKPGNKAQLNKEQSPTKSNDKSTQHSEKIEQQAKIDVEALIREREAMTELGINMSNHLSPLISDGKVRVAQNSRGIRIDINDSLLFSSGSAELAKSADSVLGDIAKLLLTNSHAIQVEGHTDNTPIHSPAFFSNWELSAVRASSVLRMFNDLGVAEFRLSALGFGSTHPLGENDTAEGRAKNRRVSVMILYDSLNADNSGGIEIKPTNSK
ncbi:MAG: flagellar motor protein MotD [Methylophilaceae bacterium]